MSCETDSAIAKMKVHSSRLTARGFFTQYLKPEMMLITSRCCRFGKNIIVVHPFLFRYIFGELSKIPCKCKHPATPDLPGGIGVVKILVFGNRFKVAVLFVIVHGPQRDIDLFFKYPVVERHIMPDVERVSGLNSLGFLPEAKESTYEEFVRESIAGL